MDILIKEVRDVIESCDMNENDVSYVALNDTYWIPWEEFVKLEKPPRVWPVLRKGQLGEWNGLDQGFRVVFKDYKWIEYYYCYGDEYYSTFVVRESKRKPMKRYWEPREPHDRKLSDFIQFKKK
jgi:hypothetical protein